MGEVLKAALEERLRQSEERFQHLAALSSDWYWEQDDQFRLTFMSKDMSAKTGLDASTYLGHHRWDQPALNLGEADWARHRAQLERHEPFRDFVIQRAGPGGRSRWLSLSGEPVFDHNGTFTGYRGIGRDITEQKAAESALRASEARFRNLTELSSDWYWEQDSELRFTKFEGSGVSGTQYSPAVAILGRVAWDIPGLVEGSLDLEAHRVRMLRREAFRDVEYSYRDRAGHQYYISISGDPIVDEAGGFAGYRGTSRDITERKRAEQALLRSRQMFEALSATNEAIMRSTSPEELYLLMCQAAVEGGKLLTTAVLVPDAGVARVVAASGVVPQALRELSIPLDRETPAAQGLAGSAFRSGASQVSNDLLRDERTRPWHAPALEHHIAAAAAIPFVKEGKVLGALLFFSDQEHAFDGEIVKLLERLAENVVFALDNFSRERQRRIAEDRIQHLATHDALTGLPNRVMFSQLLGHAIDSAQRYKRAFALLFVDLDRFKAINDTLGHQAGDQVLQAVATRLKKTVRASDVVARLSGDEFVVLVQEVAEPPQAEAVARKLIAALAAPVRIGGKDCSITASIGVSFCPQDGTDGRALLKNADDAMYRAKNEGRNGFRLYQKTPGA